MIPTNINPALMTIASTAGFEPIVLNATSKARKQLTKILINS